MSGLTFYDKTPFEYGYASKEYLVNSMNPLLKELMRQNTDKIFCDIGCGCGRNLLYASKFAKRMVGIDLSTKSLAFAKSFVNSDKLELKQGDNLDIPLDADIADLVISDGVCHHTGNAARAFSECIRILKPSGKLYLAVYKKFRYYPLVYHLIGGFFRFLNGFRIGSYIVDNIFVRVHYFMYKLFKYENLSRRETRNIFYDYFITPVATFHSRREVSMWCTQNNCQIINYDRTSGNCHVFIIKKGNEES